jgi:hypothetical protein
MVVLHVELIVSISFSVGLISLASIEELIPTENLKGGQF